MTPRADTGLPLEIRDHQARIIKQAQEMLRQEPSLLVAAPPGSGKTVVMAEIAAMCIARDQRVGLLVHRQELVSQSEEKLTRQCGRKPGVIWQNRREWDQPVLIIAQDTVSGLEIPHGVRLDLLMVDEAHHTVAPSWLRTLKRLPHRYLLGFSATPFRQDKEPLSPEPFAEIIRPVTPMELIEKKLLCPVVIESPVTCDSNGNIQPINQASNPESVYHQAVRYALSQGRTRIVLYVSQTQRHTPLQVIRRTVQILRRSGINAWAVHQEMSANQRRTALARFQSSASASALVNYMTLTEGTDLPNVDCVVIGRHTESESTIIQMIGRGQRPYGRRKTAWYCNTPSVPTWKKSSTTGGWTTRWKKRKEQNGRE